MLKEMLDAVELEWKKLALEAVYSGQTSEEARSIATAVITDCVANRLEAAAANYQGGHYE